MTKAHALRNYFKKVYGIDDLTGMSEVAVWKEFLKKNNDFDSLSSTMTGIYTEMSNNEISIGGGGGSVERVKIATINLWPNEETNVSYTDLTTMRNMRLGIDPIELDSGDICVLSFYKNGELVQSNETIVNNYDDARFDGDIRVSYYDEYIGLTFKSNYIEEADYIADFLNRYDADEIHIEYYRIPISQKILLNYTVGANEAYGYVGSNNKGYYPVITVSNAKPKSQPQTGDTLYLTIAGQMMCAACQDNYGMFSGEFLFQVHTRNGFAMIFQLDGFIQETESAALELVSSLIPALNGAHIVVFKGPDLPEAPPPYEDDYDDGSTPE